MSAADLITQAIRSPQSVTEFSPKMWDLFIRQARAAHLLPRMGFILRDNKVWETIPEKPRTHIQIAQAIADKHRLAVGWEVRCISEALAKLPIPIVLLKGAAYVVSGHPAGHGRLFSDVDILVPREQLSAVEAALMLHGWVSSVQDKYDQRYYRTWMHELPPMQHVKRQNVIDVHHTILPETGDARPDPEKLFAKTIPIADSPQLKTLSPVDMILHSATHLFHEGELMHGLRDLVDLDCLLRHFGNNAEFWEEIVERAGELGLQRSLYYAVRYSQAKLGTPIPDKVLASVNTFGPNLAVRFIMDTLYFSALRPYHSSCRNMLTLPALWLLYIRGHWLRMPPWLLAGHLLRKVITPSHDK